MFNLGFALRNMNVRVNQTQNEQKKRNAKEGQNAIKNDSNGMNQGKTKIVFTYMTFWDKNGRKTEISSERKG